MLNVKEFLFTNVVGTWQSKIMLSLSWILLVHILLFASYRIYSPVSILYSIRITHLFCRLWRYRARRCRGGARLCNVISRSRTSLWPDGNNARRCVTQFATALQCFSIFIDRLIYWVILDINASSSVSKNNLVLISCTGDFVRMRKVSWCNLHPIYRRYKGAYGAIIFGNYIYLINIVQKKTRFETNIQYLIWNTQLTINKALM